MPRNGGRNRRFGCQRLIPINLTHPPVERVCNVLDTGLAFGESPAVADSLMTIERRREARATRVAAIREGPAERLVNATPRDLEVP